MVPPSRAEALAVLGLPVTASPAEVTGAYRRLAKLSHPDATGRTDGDAGESFAAITEAYQSLTAADTARRPPRGSTPDTASPANRSTTRPTPTPRIRHDSMTLGTPRLPIVAGPVTITPYGSTDVPGRSGLTARRDRQRRNPL